VHELQGPYSITICKILERFPCDSRNSTSYEAKKTIKQTIYSKLQRQPTIYCTIFCIKRVCNTIKDIGLQVQTRADVVFTVRYTKIYKQENKYTVL